MEFDEFDRVLKISLADFTETNSFGYFGIAGSKDMKGELDLVVFPSKNVKKGEFMKSLCNFLDLLRENLGKTKLIAFPHSIVQVEAEFISKRKEIDLFVHLNSFPDLGIEDSSVIEGILSSCTSYHGSRELIGITRTDLDYYYDFLFVTNCLYSFYPKHLETKKISWRVDHVYKMNNGKLDQKGKTNKQLFFECCDFLDSRAKVI